MSPIERVLRAFDTVIDRAICVLGALLASQGPEFMQQYTQRLGGHLAEAQRQLRAFQSAATASGHTLQSLVAHAQAGGDAALRQLGTVVRATDDRVLSLTAAHDSLVHASLWSRPFVFLREFDLEIARGTAAIFKPAVPTTVEGLVYALAGMLLALALYHGIAGLLRPRRASRRATTPENVRV